VTLSCADAEAHLVDVIDGRLPPPLEMRMHAHLESCAACRGKAELWRSLAPAMRELAPSPPAALAARRMEVEIMRQLAAAPGRPARARRFGSFALLGFTFVGATAAFLLWISTARHHGPADDGPYAIVAGVSGGVSDHGRALAPSAALAGGAELEVAVGGAAELRLDRGSVIHLTGPAHLALGGSPRAVALALREGTLEAHVAHRLPDETFVVSTADARVEVRGTHFFVGASPARSWVRVQEGLVAVRLSDGSERMVGAGETVAAEHLRGGDEAPPPAAEPPATAPLPAPSPTDARSCRQVVRSCQGAAQGVRESMRGGDNDRALRLIASASHAAHDDGSCGKALESCDDELRYLRAEALRAAGRFDDAAAAYKALNRPGAPGAMRQNALYAAAELERRRGSTAAALADYEGALAASPRGALHEEAVIGSMESAELLGDHARAAAWARRYLSELPNGRAAVVARRLAGDEGPARSK
jgi:ferric-dicitrate binding protein FerR (iron transport regulator)